MLPSVCENHFISISAIAIIIASIRGNVPCDLSEIFSFEIMLIGPMHRGFRRLLYLHTSKHTP